jgi:hypothetical protein
MITTHVDTIEHQKKQIRALEKENIKLKKNIFDSGLILEALKNKIKTE